MNAILTPELIAPGALTGESALRLPLPGQEPFQLSKQWKPNPADLPADCIHQLFESQAERTPDRFAVMQQGELLSYGELNARANQLARHLRTIGVGPDRLAAIALERSAEMIIAILATLKAGGAYLPLDPAYPHERLAMMLADAQPVVLITNRAIAVDLPESPASVICIDKDWPVAAAYSSANLDNIVRPENLAYVIYTSGSTGKPKGVMVEHRAVSTFARAAASLYDIGPEDRVLQFASFSFDASAEEIYPCLISGAMLVLRTEAMIASIKGFLEQCAAWRISVLDLPTAFWHEAVEGISAERLVLPEWLRVVIIGGERALPDRVIAWRGAVGGCPRLLNTYGPTETTVVATACDLTQAIEDDAPIGRPFADAETCILNADLQPVPTGEVGELYIGGVGLARGYLDQPALTAASFIPHPFAATPGARLYKTGDLARFRPDGLIDFCGRVDNQVKIHGFRIELEEIESVMASHQAVSHCIVLAREDRSGNKRLIAYVVPARYADGLNSVVTAAELRVFLRDKLPHYMQPATYVLLDGFPIGGNGKVDRSALPVPDQTCDERRGGFVKPRDPLEHQLAQIWEGLFDQRPIGVTESFFDLGGHSLLAVRMMDRIEQMFGKSLPLATLFAGLTIEQLAQALISQEAANPHGQIVEIQRGAGGQPFFYLHGDYYGGGLYCRRLAQHLGSEQPFYALQPHGLPGQPPPDSIEVMAESHLKALREVQPRGPYLLGGHCNGGMITYEMARQLEAAGERVALLALVCAPGANTRFRTLHRLSGAYCAIKREPVSERRLRFLDLRERAVRLEGLRDYYTGRVRELWRSAPGEQMCFIRQRAWQSAGAFISAFRERVVSEIRPTYSDAEKPARHARDVTGQAYEQAMAAYMPKRYGGRVTLLWPQELPLDPSSDATCGWRRAAAEVETQIIPGGHLTCITKYVEPLAASIGLCIEKARRAS